MTDARPAGDLAAAAFSDEFPSGAATRLLVFADQYGPSQSIAFIEGLAGARGAGSAAVRLIEEAALGPDGNPAMAPALAASVNAHLDETLPTAVILSRFGHAAACAIILEAARARGTPVLCHIDDDLFGLPARLGMERYRSARHPLRMAALQQGLDEADMVIAATPALARSLSDRARHDRVGWLQNGCAGQPWPRRPAKPAGAPLVVGYMGSASHGGDLELAVPAINALLQRYPHVRFELFGSISRQPVADLLASTVTRREIIDGDYAAFRRALAGLRWDIGLAPLEVSPYNRCKTATKWVEYAEAGIAVVASDMQVYQPIIAADAAAAAEPAQWERVLDRLIRSPALRDGLIQSADLLLSARYGWDRLEASVLELLARAGRSRTAAVRLPQTGHVRS